MAPAIREKWTKHSCNIWGNRFKRRKHDATYIGFVEKVRELLPLFLRELVLEVLDNLHIFVFDALVLEVLLAQNSFLATTYTLWSNIHG